MRPLSIPRTFDRISQDAATAEIRDAAAGKSKKLKEACDGFEAMFLRQLMGEMRKTVPEGGLFEKNQAEKIWQSQLDGEIADRVATGGRGIGISDVLYRQLSAKPGMK